MERLSETQVQVQIKRNSYFNYDVCRACGGWCCKNMAGSYIPEDFKEELTSDFILSLLKTGKFAIDWWEGGNHYIRPRHVNEGAVVGSWGGVCINWSQEKGCSLSEEERPFQCRKLIPRKNGNCDQLKKDKASKFDCSVRWKDYQDQIIEAINKFRENGSN